MSDKFKGNFKLFAKDLLIALAIAGLILVFIRPNLVKETSMLPTISPNDYILMSKQSYTFFDIKRGDIIIFKSSIKREDGKGNKQLIKRVIGVPGDVITIANNKVYINGYEVEEKYTFSENTYGEIYNLKVQEGEVFVMGDHREVSMDSRKLGCIDEDLIVGKAVFRLYPFNKIGAL